MWALTSENRLTEWKEFRQQISELDFDEAVTKTVNLWSSAPFVTHYLDRIESIYWPNPWELLTNNKYDDMARSLGMIYTLFLSRHGQRHTFAISEMDTQFAHYNLVDIDSGKYILNYNFNEVMNNEQLGSNIQLTKSYSAEDLQLYKY